MEDIVANLINFIILKMDSQIKEYLKQIANNTSPKLSNQIILKSDKTEFNTEFPSPIELNNDKSYEIALVNLETYYSFPNVHKHNNVLFYYTPNDPSTPQKVVIPIGSYEIEALNEEIKKQIAKNRGDPNLIDIEQNNATLKCLMKIKPGYKIEFKGNRSLKQLLGFRKKQYNAGNHIAENIVEIISVDAILIHINIITGSYVDGETTPVIYSFYPNVSPGYKIVENPKNLIYLPVNTKTIKNIKVKVTDQNSELINLRGEEIILKFHLKEV